MTGKLIESRAGRVGFPEPSPAVSRKPVRTVSIDLLRGLFILLMTVGFAIPGGVLPNWMYHRQYPGGGEYAAIVGMTWRDVTLGGFLFTLAAAIPVTMSVRLERGATIRDILLVALRRGFMLFAFALIIGHSATHFTGDFTRKGFLTAISGYLLCVVIFTRRPPGWDARVWAGLQMAGWGGVFALIALWPHLFGESFSPGRRDDIIALLAFAAVAGIVIWLFTRTRLEARLAVLAVIVALRLSSRWPGWVEQLWSLAPVPWLFHWSFVDTLLVIIPGTIVGDLIVKWSREDHGEGNESASVWSRRRLWGVTAAVLAVEPLLVYGLYKRWVGETSVLLVLLGVLAFYLVKDPSNPHETLVSKLVHWGFFWSLVGIFLEPFEGGVTKVPGTLSYYFTVTGIAVCLLAGAVVVLDVLGVGRRGITPVTDVGQNPMAAYMLMPMLVLPLLQLVPQFTPNASTTVAVVVRISLWLIITAGIIGFLTRRRLLWRT